ncbi:MAG: mechanosensitive ion channel family protein, partial [Gammaproteobacteria bacterium]
MMQTSLKLIARFSGVSVVAPFVCLFLALSVPMAFAKVSDPKLDPLRPADTSSPRDTLQSFLTDSNKFTKDFLQDKRTEDTYRAFRRAIQTLDFSTTTEGDSWFVRNRRVALLQELLARIEIPPVNQIPSDLEVADGSVTQWTIPNTSITIAKLEDGPRAGQFLFSADTVQQLDALYRQAKDIPYRKDAVGGIYEEMINRDTRVQGQERELRERLKPVDTSNPRSTLEGFLDNVNRAYELIEESNAKLQVKPPTMTRKEAREVEIKAANFLKRAIYTVDLSQVPKALRHDVGIEAVLQLKEVIDRMLLPPIDSIPNPQMVATVRKDVSDVVSQAMLPFRWRLPNTQITIAEIIEGDLQGQFLFNSGTVKNINSIYNKIKDLPYRQAEFGGIELEYRSPGISPGFYENYVLASGYLIPQAHFMGRLVDGLPVWFKSMVGGQMVWQWTGLLLCVLLLTVATYTVFHYITLLANKIRFPQQDWLKVLAPIFVLLLVITIGKFIDIDLNFTGDVHAAVATSFEAITLVLTAWVIYAFCKAVAETIVATPKMRELTSESALLRIGARVIGFLAAVWIIIDGIRELGADLIPLLAGLGVGGLAVALAAQSTIANFIGSLILFANKPVRVGDFCRYGEDPSPGWLRIGTVEEIG